MSVERQPGNALPNPATETATDRLELARAFLRAAVFRSRELQAAHGPGPAADGSGLCGLGAQAAVTLELGETGRALFARLWPEDLDERRLGRVHALVREWVQRQDGLDRRRNHFLKAFRNEHGFDRRSYSPELQARYERGLAEINAEAEASLDDTARALLDAE